MENYLEFKGEKYYAVGCCNFYRTDDGKKMFFLHLANHPVWLSSDSPIHIELREHVMMDEGYPHGDVKNFDKGIVQEVK